MLLETELAYIAGLIDGEGSIFVSGNHTLILAVSNTDKDVLEYCKNIFNVGHVIIQKVRSERHKVSWYWKNSGKGAKKVIKLVLPFLKIKKAQARLALSFPTHLTPKPFTKNEQDVRQSIYRALKILNKRGV